MSTINLIPKAIREFPSAVSDIGRNGWNDDNKGKVINAVTLIGVAEGTGAVMYFAGATILKAIAVAALILSASESIGLVIGGFLCKHGIPAALAGWNAGLFGATLVGTATTVLGAKFIAGSVSQFVIHIWRDSVAKSAHPVPVAR